MGAAQSIPPDPVPDPNIFINIGCVGLDTLASNSNRLASAPFLYINFQATNYNEMIYNILTCVQLYSNSITYITMTTYMTSNKFSRYTL
jgi:hypothetical protein